MIIYPEVLKNTNVNLNIFWKTLIQRISIGEFPYGTKIVDNKLIYKKSSICLEDTNSEKIVNFFEKNVGLNLKYIHYDSWKKIKKKIIKDNLIQDFVNKEQKENNLSIQQSNYLFSLIHLYVTLKKIDSDDIILETYPYTHIREIKSLVYDNMNNTYVLINTKYKNIESPLRNDDDDDDDE